jgi:hypothetical protein
MISHIFLLLIEMTGCECAVKIRDMINDHEERWTLGGAHAREPREWAREIFVEMGYKVKEVSDLGFDPISHFYVITDQPELSLKDATARLTP